MANVFISSTGIDLKDYRAAAIDSCNRLGIVPIAMEFFEAVGDNASAGSISKLNSSDVYVGIFAYRYGYIGEGQTRSVTEIEFDAAGELGLERLCFLLDKDHPWPAEYIDNDRLQLENFREKINRSVIRNEFTTVDDFKAKLFQSLSEWQKKSPQSAAFETILDLFATRRAFFKGDERAIDGVVKMMAYSDAGRALAVARSFIEVVAEVQSVLAQLGSKLNTGLKQSVTRLIVACKDYVENYGPREGESNLPLPHIGWGQRIEDFTFIEERYNLSSNDSFEVFCSILNYIKRSFIDLLEVRRCAIDVIDRIHAADPAFKNRCLTLRSSINDSNSYLENCFPAIDRVIEVIHETMKTTGDLLTRKSIIAERLLKEDNPLVSSMLAGIKKINTPYAWTKRNPDNTLVSAEIVGEETVKVVFADGFSGELKFDKETCIEYWGITMDQPVFLSMQLNADSNMIVWKDGPYITGEAFRKILNSS